jgi:hypothetical protein
MVTTVNCRADGYFPNESDQLLAGTHTSAATWSSSAPRTEDHIDMFFSIIGTTTVKQFEPKHCLTQFTQAHPQASSPAWNKVKTG